MEKLRIEGKTPLKGEVIVSGAKNAAVAILPATLLVKGVTTLKNLPDISDVRKYCKIMEELGAKIDFLDRRTVKIDTRKLSSTVALSENVRKFRASYYMLRITSWKI